MNNWFAALYQGHGSQFFDDTAEFCGNLTTFLASPAAKPFVSNVRLGVGGGAGNNAASGSCGITASRIGFQHRDYTGSKEQVAGKNKMREVVDEAMAMQLVDAFAMGDAYRNWETNEVSFQGERFCVREEQGGRGGGINSIYSMKNSR